jgi:aminoglycoside 3-N-acetyltransferase
MNEPITRAELVQGLGALGVRTGDLLIVHASLSAFGHIVGGAHALCLALGDAVGAPGTLVMPGFTPQLCHPTTWSASRLDGAAPARLAAHMPSFDSRATPVARTIGRTADCFRAMPEVHRSAHPHTSFLAQGPKAASLLATHPAAYRFSRWGPLGRLYQADAKVLLLGVPWSRCTALHLAEYECAYPGRRQGGWLVPGVAPPGAPTVWEAVDELLVWEGDFDLLGADFIDSAPASYTVARIGAAHCRLVGMRELVRFALAWLPQRRDLRAYGVPPGWIDVCLADAPLPLPATIPILPPGR